eukprot:COSAG05_NODE_1692_length_4267_cov_7.040770_2_plen_453_part_00
MPFVKTHFPQLVAFSAQCIALQSDTPPCSTQKELQAINANVTQECCNEPKESCRSGMPTLCNAGCAAVVLPAVKACTAAGGALTNPANKVLKSAYMQVAARCTATVGDTSLCSTQMDLLTIGRKISKECCNEPKESCKKGMPTICNAGCAAVVLPAVKACTAAGGALTNPANSAFKRAYMQVAAKCTATATPVAPAAEPTPQTPMAASNGSNTIPPSKAPPPPINSKCHSLGGTCSTCLRLQGCDWSQQSGKCFTHNTGKHDARDLRTAIDTQGGNKKPSISAICQNKCTSKTCPVPNSECKMKNGQPRCFCKPDPFGPFPHKRVAEGPAGHATLCVLPHMDTEVVSRCINAAPNPAECAHSRLSDAFAGCASTGGYSRMSSVCASACGEYCKKKKKKDKRLGLPIQGCLSKDGMTDYATFYCEEAGLGRCDDTTAIDYACPHHTIGACQRD